MFKWFLSLEIYDFPKIFYSGLTAPNKPGAKIGQKLSSWRLSFKSDNTKHINEDMLTVNKFPSVKSADTVATLRVRHLLGVWACKRTTETQVGRGRSCIGHNQATVINGTTVR